MIARYFGLPGCGKTTTLAMLALNASKSGKYKHIYSNVQLSIPNVTYFDFDWIGKYKMEDCLILIDEAMICAGDRDYKNFGKDKLWAFVEHRHFNQDIILFSQEADGVDKKIRSVSARMYYIKKGCLLGHWFSSIIRVPYSVMFPDPKSSKLGEIIMGYQKPPLLSRIFAQRIYRPKYYQYFDSWVLDRDLPPAPDNAYTYKPDLSPARSLGALIAFNATHKNLISNLLKYRIDG